MSSPQNSFSLRKIVYDPKIRGLFFQTILFALLLYFFYSIITNTVENLQSRGIPIGFGFLDNASGFPVSFKLISYITSDSNAKLILVGLLNTLFVAVLGIITATILGLIFGVMRLSKNSIISAIATVYIEVLRNIPLLVQILLLYYGVLKTLPLAKDSLSFLGIFFANIKGISVPTISFGSAETPFIISIIVALIIMVALRLWSRKRQEKTGQQFPATKIGFAILIGLPLLILIASGWPVEVSIPELGRFSLKGGMTISPEFIALYLALSIYTSAFIAETVRAGIMSVSHGQTEASDSLGLPRNKTLNLIIIPQALRVIIPPLTSQYLNLTKNSSLAVAIGYTDLFASAGGVLNITGQALELIAITMTFYLLFSLLTSMFMNWYNSRIKLVER